MTSKALQAVTGGAVAAAVFLGGGTVASAGTARAIPANFLLHEKTAREPVKYPGEEEWTISESRTRTLLVNPCDLKPARDKGRRDKGREPVAMRTVGYTAPEHFSGEQVVVYRSSAAAKAAMASLRGQVKRCARDADGEFVTRAYATPVRIGDEAFRFASQNYHGAKPAIGGERAVVVRKARAVAIYAVSGEYGRIRSSDYAKQLKEAEKMAAKLCSLPVTGC
jgi:hypothetical protein